MLTLIMLEEASRRGWRFWPRCGVFSRGGVQVDVSVVSELGWDKIEASVRITGGEGDHPNVLL